MIDENGTLTYTYKDSIFLSWVFENSTLNTVVIALLSTIISLQAAAIFFDLTLGFKTRGTFKVHDLHIFFLSCESFAGAILDATFRNDWITRKRLRGDVPKHATITRDPRKIRRRVCARLSLLLLIGPLLNIIIISMSIETNRVYTFREAGLGGLAFSIDQKFQVQLEFESPVCNSSKVSYGKTDSALTTFHRCTMGFSDYDAEDIIESQGARLIVGYYQSGYIYARVWNETVRRTMHLWGEIRRPGEILWVKPEVSEKDLDDFADIGLSKLEKKYGLRFERGELQVKVKRTYLGYSGTCSITYESMEDVLRPMLDATTFKDAAELRVVNFLDIPFGEEEPAKVVSADDIPFARRTRGLLTLLISIIIAVIIVLLRMLIRCVAYNDFPIAAEIIVKDRLGLHACDSMLQDDIVVEYRKEFRDGEKGSFKISVKGESPKA